MCHHASQFVLISQTVAEIWLFFDFGLFFFGGGVTLSCDLDFDFQSRRAMVTTNTHAKHQCQKSAGSKQTDGRT